VGSVSSSTAIPKELLRELHGGLIRIKEVLDTIEELMDEEGPRRIPQSRRRIQ